MKLVLTIIILILNFSLLADEKIDKLIRNWNIKYATQVNKCNYFVSNVMIPFVKNNEKSVSKEEELYSTDLSKEDILAIIKNFNPEILLPDFHEKFYKHMIKSRVSFKNMKDFDAFEYCEYDVPVYQFFLTSIYSSKKQNWTQAEKFVLLNVIKATIKTNLINKNSSSMEYLSYVSLIKSLINFGFIDSKYEKNVLDFSKWSEESMRKNFVDKKELSKSNTNSFISAFEKELTFRDEFKKKFISFYKMISK